MRWLVLLLILHSFIFGEEIEKYNPIQTTYLKDGSLKVKVAFNYLDSSLNIQRIRGTDGIHTIKFPLPGNWEVIDAKGYLKYDSSILLLKDHSAGVILLNNALLSQFKLFEKTKTGAKFSIEPELLVEHNTLSLEMIQHYTHECEDGSSSELWTDVDLKKSYLEFHVRIKAIPEEIRSVATHVLDDKQYTVAPINYVLSQKPTDEELRHYTLFTGAAANQLQYRLAPITASYQINPKTHNVFIGSREKALNLLNALSITAPSKVSHDINVIRNPMAMDKAIILITPEESDAIDETLYALYKNDLSMYRRQGLNIDSVLIPEPALAYTAKDYIPVGEKIFFKELGYKTTTLKGWYPPVVSLDFKVYPDHYFDDKDRIDTHLNYVFPTTVHRDSVVNIFLNEKFAKQVDIMEAAEHTSSLSLRAGELFNWTDYSGLPAYLVNKGFNNLRFNLSLVPDKKGHCEIFNTENLVAMILDNSYLILPDSKRWIEMPYMQYVGMSTYPYSIYPDLQDTQLLLTRSDPKTVASAMNFMFFITQEMRDFPSYVSISRDMQNADTQKHLVVFGSIHDEILQSLSEEAPVSFLGTHMHRPYPFVKRFVEYKSILDDDRTIKHRFMNRMHETNQLDSAIMMQEYRSPFNSDKTVLMFSAENGPSLYNGVTSLLQYKNRQYIQGDALIYDPISEEGIAYNIKQKYIITDMNWLDHISLIVSENPIRYFFVLFILLLLAAWLVRRLLLEFKRRNHKDVD
ncbi:MAG: cellulose biosynthesis cyclic di-GMP-binding regulatory protein BcsB [Campylobacterota bacterium]|nr:cellulose biosynthesis cyclic di-GMP-binding regulatory protein BcsB [Campylobacterota bacterium]